MNAKPMCIGIPQRLAAFAAAPYQPLFCDRIEQILFGSFGGALTHAGITSKLTKANPILLTRNINASLLQKL
jgi:hypothetical protein